MPRPPFRSHPCNSQSDPEDIYTYSVQRLLHRQISRRLRTRKSPINPFFTVHFSDLTFHASPAEPLLTLLFLPQQQLRGQSGEPSE